MCRKFFIPFLISSIPARPARDSSRRFGALRRATVAACLTAFTAQAGAAGEARLPAPVVQALGQARIAAGDASFFVQEIGARKPLLAVNADRAQNPASVIKLVTTYAGLELLGPAYSWKTQFVSAAPQHGDVLAGDLHVRASGDPRFVWEHLWQVLGELRGRGVREIRGDLVVDRSIFAPIDHDDARFDGDAVRAYNVGPDAFLFNFKATMLRFTPLDDRVVVVMEPHAPETQPVANLRLVDGPCLDWRSRIHADFSNPARPAFNGDYPRDCGVRRWYANLVSHDEYLRLAFSQLWTELGGSLPVGFAVRSGPVPAGARLLSEWTSPALAEQIRDINKFSNNVMARQLFLALGGDMNGAPRSAENARRTLTAWLAGKGIDTTPLVLENGSGLSRSERASARLLGGLLLAAFNSAVMPEFMASLPIVGADGTMRKRLVNDRASGAAHVKTGTLDGVRAIAGYVLAASGRRYVVVSIVNDAHAGAAQPLHDALLRWVHAGG